MGTRRSSYPTEGFTLIELLVVIAIIAILAVVVVLTLNPAELLRQSRDANRVSDMSTLVHAVGIYQADQGGGSGYSMGSPSTIYISLPDPTLSANQTSSCTSLGLKPLPGGYIYQCSSLANYRNTNGTGWIPINFSAITTGAPLGSLPVDPINQSSSGLFYTYTTNGNQYEVTSGMESIKYQAGGSGDVITNDGGTLANTYTQGTSLSLEPVNFGGSSGISFIQSTSTYVGSGGTETSTFPSNVSAGDLIIAVADSANTNCFSYSITDSLGNTYVSAATSTTPAPDGSMNIFYAHTATGGPDSVHFVDPCNGSQYLFAIFEYSGIASGSPVDVKNASMTSSGSTLNTGSSTITNSNELLFSQAFDYSSGPTSSLWTVSSGWTKRESPTGGGYEDAALIADETVSSLGTYSNTFGGLPSGDDLGAQIVTFK